MRVARSLSVGPILALLVAAACGGSDDTPPRLRETSPAADAQGVESSATIRGLFSEPIRASSVTSATFTLLRAGAAAPVDGTFAVAGEEVSFTPAAPLVPGASYTATFTTGVTDAAGNGLAAPCSWSFTTVANLPPVASAGAGQDVSFAQPVGLDGTASADPDGTSLSFAWAQVGGPPVELAGAATATPTFTAPAEVATLRFELTVTDASAATSVAMTTVRVWVDAAKVVLVSLGGSDGAAGGFGAPMRTLAAAIPQAISLGAGGAVYAAEGLYPQAAALDVTAGIGVYGGFDQETWDRDPASHPTVVGGFPIGFVVEAAGVTLDGLTIEPADALAFGGSSIAVLVRSSADVRIARCSIRAGRGAAGLAGWSGPPGARGANGSAGGPGQCDDTDYFGTGGPGGAGIGGTDGGRGGRGGNSSTAPRPGERGLNYLGLGLGSMGGAAGIGWVGASGGTGGAGGRGLDGALGAGGAAFGAISALGYEPAAGAPGTNGTAGSGGGGGGGSAGQWGDWVYDGTGNGGGGGGGGSGGGGGGSPGGGGGGSFGIVILGSTGVEIRDATVQAGDGGAGGAGGVGGYGGSPSSGGHGNTNCSDEIGSGGDGGPGGVGGWGGGGGGGGGGPSIAILQSAGSSTTLTEVAASPGAGGAGGAPNGSSGETGGHLLR
jgi:hypothetical protein